MTLTATLTTAPAAAAFECTLTVTNTDTTAVTVTFRTGQRIAVTATTPDGTSRWQYGTDRAFPQVLGSCTWAPGAAKQFTARWQAPPPGTYRLQATLQGRPDVEATTTVTV